MTNHDYAYDNQALENSNTMSQTHQQTLIETATKQSFSFIKNYCLSWLFLHWLNLPISSGTNLVFTVLMAGQSFVVEYLFRRYFEWRWQK